MTTIESVGVAAAPSSKRPTRTPAVATGELAKLTSQLSDCVNCASSKTSAGQAKIAEISGKINAIKAQAQRAETASLPSAPPKIVPNESAVKSAQVFRMDGVGSRLNVVA